MPSFLLLTVHLTLTTLAHDLSLSFTLSLVASIHIHIHTPTCRIHETKTTVTNPWNKTEAEFVAAFDSLLRNNRDQVPPQNFYERLVHILMRKRDPIMPSNRRESMGGDATAAGIGGGDRCSTHEDDRLVRATIDIFRRIHAQHPVSSIELQRQGSRRTLHSNTSHLYFYFFILLI